MNKVLNSVKEYFAEFKILKKTPPEFWNLNLVINFFEMLAYFMFITVISLYLTENIGLDDEWSQNLVGLFTTLITIIIFFSGVFIDWLGIKAALFLSMAILIPGRFLLGFTVPLEEHLITNKLEDPAVQEMALTRIAERELDKRYFTQDALKLRAAQLDWLMQDEEIVKSGVTKTDLENDMANRMAKLTEGFTRDPNQTGQALGALGRLGPRISQTPVFPIETGQGTQGEIPDRPGPHRDASQRGQPCTGRVQIGLLREHQGQPRYGKGDSGPGAWTKKPARTKPLGRIRTARRNPNRSSAIAGK